MARRLIDFAGIAIDIDKIDYIEKTMDKTFHRSYPYGIVVVYFDRRSFEKWWDSPDERDDWYEWLFKKLY